MQAVEHQPGLRLAAHTAALALTALRRQARAPAVPLQSTAQAPAREP